MLTSFKIYGRIDIEKEKRGTENMKVTFNNKSNRTFDTLSDGDFFTARRNNDLYMKIEAIYDENSCENVNGVLVHNGELCCFNDDETVTPYYGTITVE